MLDTTPITTAITAMIRTGTTEQALLAAVAHLFPNLTPTELPQALQVAQAERSAVRPVAMSTAAGTASGLDLSMTWAKWPL
jgi:hypothetical protein